MLKRIFWGLALCLVSAATMAQEVPAPAELKQLDWSIGSWEGNVKWLMPGMEGDSKMTFTNEREGHFVKSKSTSEMMGMKMTEIAYVGWNAKTGKFDSYTFTNFASTPRIEHGEVTGSKLVFVSEPWVTTSGTYTSRATMQSPSPDTIQFFLEFQEEGKWVKAAEGQFKRKA